MVDNFNIQIEMSIVREQCQNEFKGWNCMKMETTCQTSCGLLTIIIGIYQLIDIIEDLLCHCDV